MLKHTNVKLELLTDTDMVLMVKRGIRGSLTQVVKRRAVANHKYLPSYGSTKKSVFLQYLDANNLYGYAMSQKLPLDGYKWDNIEKFTSDFVKNYVNGDKGYLLEVDVEYPKKLLGAHADLPFLPERRYKIPKHHNKKEYDDFECKEYDDKVKKDIAKAHKKVYEAFNIIHEPENKLIATVQDKNKYVCNISTLQMALNCSLRLQKVYRAIKFNQSACLKPYIDKNTKFRTVAKNDFAKNFFKLMNNAVFGKMIENGRKQHEIKLVVTEQRRKKLVSEPNYKLCVPFSDHLLATEMRKTRIYMDKPKMVGQAILDKSKELMYHFYYDYLKPKYKENVKLMYMDTDSFVLEIETCDFFEDIKNDLEKWFDTSGYDKNMVLPDEYAKIASINKKVFGKMKDELGKGYMTEFVALSPKMYAYKQIQLDNSLTEHKKAEGTKKMVTKKHLCFDVYKKCLFENKTFNCIQHRIKSSPMSVDTIEINKIALKNYDNKRLRSFNGITTYPYGTNAFKICLEELKIKQAFATYFNN